MFLLATRGWFETLERDIIHTLTCKWNTPGWGRTFLAVQKDELGVPLFVMALLLIAFRSPRRAARALMTGAIALGLAMGLATLLWAAVDRRRPPFSYERWLRTPEDKALCADNENWIALHKGPSRRPSFPSRHALTVGCMVTALCLASRWIGLGAVFYGALVVVGRVYAGRHWPSDMLVGVVLGVVLALVVWRFVPRLPGLSWLQEPREKLGDRAASA